MSKTYPKLDFWQRERVWELHRASWSGAAIARQLADGFPQHEPPIAPAKISGQAVTALIRTMKLERDRLYSTKLAHVPTEDALLLARRKLSLIANAEADRLAERQRAGRLDADQLRKLAAAQERIERMEVAAAKRAPAADPPPRSKADQDAETQEEEAPSFTTSLLRQSRADGGDPAPQAVTEDGAVPDDPERQDTDSGGEAPA